MVCVAISWGFTFSYLALTNQIPPLQYNDLWTGGLVVTAFVVIAVGMAIPPLIFRQQDDLSWLWHVGIISTTLMLVFLSLHVLFVSLLIASIV